MKERIEWLSHHPSVETIARAAKVFGQDPVMFLEDSQDEFRTQVRIAAWLVVGRDEKEAADRMKKK